MSVSPGDIVHMDHCGACKFPADKLPEVLQNATELISREAKEKARFEDTNFSIERWKSELKGRRKEK
jgi:regulator of RNase E activity RraA